MKTNLTQEYLKECFDYIDGVLYWKRKPSKSLPIGIKAGCNDKDGYLMVSLDNKIYKVHRLIFMMFHGYFPLVVDHIDGNKQNNKIENLRGCTKAENSWNSKKHFDNKSGVKGVYFHKKSNKWMARCTANKKTNYLGLFDSLNDAEKAVQNFRVNLHKQFYNHGKQT